MEPVSEISVNLYVYGVVPAEAKIPRLTGLQGEEIMTVPSDAHAALVSPLPDPEAIGTPDDLLAHSSVLDRIAASAPVLPMVFGTVVPNVETLTDEVLEPQYGLYEENLRRIGDAAQFSLHARFVRDTVLGELIREEAEIASLREAISGTSEDETRDERIRLGELIVQGLQRKAEAEAPRIRSVLEPLSRETVEREIGQAEDILDLAALVERERQAEFEQAAESLAQESAGRITFRLIGPQAPYDFTGEV
ncbi:GvpL/GvpF family gas vesicle protein [Sinomonas susongensis]|uniref:GvpL/GvpF family gas vesicle protein n=1 Tax=Sinomonas susongensis TaxID=1324851 RepID=UPI001109BC63|nr:GvpL/GvpF family gas vesicle protein [Sinomonas susongensis]